MIERNLLARGRRVRSGWHLEGRDSWAARECVEGVSSRSIAGRGERRLEHARVQPRGGHWVARAIAFAVLATVGGLVAPAVVRASSPASAVESAEGSRDDGPQLMPTPVGFERGAANLFAQTVPEERTTTVRVHTVANCGVDPDAPPERFLTTARKVAVRLCSFEVQFGGPEETWVTLVEASRTPGRTGGVPVSIVGLTDFGAAWPGPEEFQPFEGSSKSHVDAFAASIDAALARSGGDEIFVFVHGFDTGFVQNAGFSAGLYHYLGRRGAMVLFEWPSQASLLDYNVDRASARASTRTFRILLEMLGSRTKARKIHVLAHSAGAPIALMAIDQLKLSRQGMPLEEARRALRLGQLILVAPDMDLWEAFDAVLDRATELPERMTIYSNPHDLALGIAAWITGGTRLGRALERLDNREIEYLNANANVQLVSVAQAELHAGTWLGHGYYWNNPWVTTDVILNLLTDATPVERGLSLDPASSVYRFGELYPQRVRAAAIALTEDLGQIDSLEERRDETKPPPDSIDPR